MPLELPPKPSAARPWAASRRYLPGGTPMTRANFVVKVPRLDQPTPVAMSVTLSAVHSNLRRANSSRIAHRYRIGG